MTYLGWLAILLLLCGCGPKSPEDFREAGQRRAALLTQDLRAIKSQEQLLAAQDKLKGHFDALVDLMIRAEELRLRDALPLDRTDFLDDQWNIDLQAQLQRVCRLTKGLEILEACQEAALHRLDRAKSADRLPVSPSKR